MEPIYFEGPPPDAATMSVSVRSLDTLRVANGQPDQLVRLHLTLDWKVAAKDFRTHRHLVHLVDWQKSNARTIPLPAPTGTLLDTFTCRPGQVTARLLADMGSKHLLELWQQSVPTEAMRP
jgi:hypothetical protein